MSRYVYGLDPASKNDYFGIVIHEIPDFEGDEENMPRLVTLRMFTHVSYDDALEILKVQFERYPPYRIVIDDTNERTFSDILERDYGRKVERISFSNTSKLMLKQDGLSIMKQGYKFPKNVKDLEQKQLLDVLIKQLKREQVSYTKSGKTTFDHPTGEHNDVSTAWELSIHGCLKVMNRRPTRHHAAFKKYNRNDIDYPESVRQDLQSLGRTVYYPDSKRFYEL